MSDDLLRLENTALREAIARLESLLRAPWLALVREELEGEAYSQAVANRDAVECLRLLRVPGSAVLLDPIPVEHVRAVLSAISPTAAMTANAGWLKIVDQQTALLIGVVEVPRARVEPLRQAAVASGVLAADYQIGAVAMSAMDRLKCADIVASPAHIVQAMRW
jgi:hypothetical protein